MLEMADIILHNSNSKDVNPSTSMMAMTDIIADIKCCIRTMSFKTLATHHFSSAGL